MYDGYLFGAHDVHYYSCDCPMLKYGGWWDACCRSPCGLTMPYNDPTYPFGWNCNAETTIKLMSVKMMVRRGWNLNIFSHVTLYACLIHVLNFDQEK